MEEIRDRSRSRHVGGRALRCAPTWVVIAGAATVFFVGLGRPSYETSDVTRYAQMVLEMRHGGTLVPTLHGRPYHEAAPLVAWAPYFASWATGGLTPLSVRLLPAIAAFASALLALQLGARRSLRVGWIAGAATALNLLLVSYGHASRADTLLGLGVTGAVASFYAGAGASTPLHRSGSFALAGVGAALGIAAKGPYAVVLTAAALAPFLVFERDWRALFAGGAIAATTAASLTAAWVVPYLHYLGPDQTVALYQQLLVHETADKFAGGYGKLEPVWTYLVELVPKLAPWSLLALPALVRVVRRPHAASNLERLCTSWLVLPLILLSLSRGKHVRYLIPLVPALAVLAACELDRWLDALARRPVPWVDAVAGGFGKLLCATGLAGTIGLWAYHGRLDVYAVAMGLTCAAGGAFASVLARQRRLPASLLGLYAGMAAAVAFVYACVLPLPAMTRRASYARLGEAVARHVSADDHRLQLVQSSDPARAIDASQLALHLGNHWVASTAAREMPASGLVLTDELVADWTVRAQIEWERRRRAPPELWYLLEAPPS